MFFITMGEIAVNTCVAVMVEIMWCLPLMNNRCNSLLLFANSGEPDITNDCHYLD